VGNAKGIEHAELHKTIWRIASDPRGSVDGWDLESDVLGTLFYRFAPENLTVCLTAEIARIVARQAELRTAIDAIVADLEGNAA
jgi:type I restriction enzyme M protein